MPVPGFLWWMLMTPAIEEPKSNGDPWKRITHNDKEKWLLSCELVCQDRPLSNSTGADRNHSVLLRKTSDGMWTCILWWKDRLSINIPPWCDIISGSEAQTEIIHKHVTEKLVEFIWMISCQHMVSYFTAVIMSCTIKDKESNRRIKRKITRIPFKLIGSERKRYTYAVKRRNICGER